MEISCIFSWRFMGRAKKQVKHYIFLSKKAENGNFHLIVPVQCEETASLDSAGAARRCCFP